MLADNQLYDFVHNSGPWLPVAIALVLFLWVFMRIRRRQSGPQRFGGTAGTSSSANTVARESQPISPAELRAVATELNALLVELHETARQLAAQMDNRTTRLDLLLAEADEKIKRLEALQAKLPPGGAISGGAEQPRPTTPDTTSLPMEDPNYHRIYDLADRGHTPREIATQVGAHPGEVELILNLRAKPGAA